MELKVEPYKSVGEIKLLMSRKDVRNTINSQFKEFLKTTTPSDAFRDEGIYIYYDDQNRCEAIEMASPANPVLFEKELVNKPFSQIKSILELYDQDLEIDADGLTSYKLGIGLYAPDHEELPSSPVESVIVFKEGYYNE